MRNVGYVRGVAEITARLQKRFLASQETTPCLPHKEETAKALTYHLLPFPISELSSPSPSSGKQIFPIHPPLPSPHSCRTLLPSPPCRRGQARARRGRRRPGERIGEDAEGACCLPPALDAKALRDRANFPFLVFRSPSDGTHGCRLRHRGDRHGCCRRGRQRCRW